MPYDLNLLLDAHVHLQSYPEDVLPKALTRARNVGVTRFGCCGTSAADWDRVLFLSKTEPGVQASFGLHPWFVGKPGTPDWRERLESLLADNPLAGVGEIGLDGTRAMRSLQSTCFIAQLELAERYGRRLALHCVKAHSEMAAILKKHAKRLFEVLLHAPSCSLEQWRDYNKLGVCVSIGPQVLSSRSDKMREIARLVPENRLFYETDSPSMAINGCGVAELGGLNSPENLPRIMVEVQRLRVKPEI